MNPYDTDDEVAELNFEQQRELAGADGWLQGRYYGEEGDTVKEILSYDRVFDICPFEVGVNRKGERREYAKRFRKIVRLMKLNELICRPFNSLSNGEMRRALFARAILKKPRKLILDDPMAGLDPVQRERMKRIIKALAKDGIDVSVKCRYEDEFPGRAGSPNPTPSVAPCEPTPPPEEGGAPVVELNDIHIRFGRRKLFDGFSWTVRQGEHWVIRGPNGSGKTTLMALITGDSPLAYANDVKVFGIPREPGFELGAIRRRIAMVSPEMQTYLDKDAGELLREALSQKPDLLILDEPFLNLDERDAARQLKKVSGWLKKHPKTAAILIAHRDEHVPPEFTRSLILK